MAVCSAALALRFALSLCQSAGAIANRSANACASSTVLSSPTGFDESIPFGTNDGVNGKLTELLGVIFWVELAIIDY